MALVKVRPTSPGRRAVVKVVNPDLYKGRPHDALLERKTKTAGRNNTGQITTRHMGGGHKQHYRVIDFKRDKDGIVAKVELDTMTRVIDDCDIRIPRFLGKLAQRLAKLIRGDVEFGFNGIEACGLEHGGDGSGVIRRIGEFCDPVISGIANDQGNPLFGQCRTTAEPNRNNQKNKKPKCAHEMPPDGQLAVTTAK